MTFTYESPRPIFDDEHWSAPDRCGSCSEPLDSDWLYCPMCQWDVEEHVWDEQSFYLCSCSNERMSCSDGSKNECLECGAIWNGLKESANAEDSYREPDAWDEKKARAQFAAHLKDTYGFTLPEAVAS